MTWADILPLLEVLPHNGLDRSLHVPVLIGLLYLAFFKETLGWTYAGIVVPGYLATVFMVAPVTGALMIVEGVLAYLLAALAGRWLPRFEAWSTLFGRERFLFIILCALLVRLVLEAVVIPVLVERYELQHARELYSIGLVLVPLLANSFWNAGLRAALPRVAFVTVLTFLTIDVVLLRYTNFTVSRFQVANEAVSLLFLETPHAYVILVVGAVLAARDNVRYGWDYNGILVPALLAVACYQPTKLVTTVVEALVVLVVAQFVTSRGPLARILWVGSRRMVAAYLVGFILKWCLGYAVLFVAPSVEMVDYFGFGYLLPTLLAVKMWNTDRVGSTLMPTLQVAVTAFLLGNGLAILLRIALPGPPVTELRSVATLTESAVPYSLMLGDTAPHPTFPASSWRTTTPSQQALAVLNEIVATPPSSGQLQHRFQPSLAIERRQKGWWTIAPRSVDPDSDVVAPRLAVRIPAHLARPWLVVAQTDQVADPAIVVGFELAKCLQARALIVRSRLERMREVDDAFLRQAVETLGIEHVLHVLSAPDGPRLSSVGAVPAGLDVTEMGNVLGADVELVWRAPQRGDSPLLGATRLEVPAARLEAAGARIWQAPPAERWAASAGRELHERLVELTTVAPGRFRQPLPEELRLYGGGLLPRVLAQRRERQVGPWTRAVAAHLGLRIAEVGASAAVALYEPPGLQRRGVATLLVRRRGQAAHPGSPSSSGATGESGRQVLIEVPAPRWEIGVGDAAVALYRGLGADGVLLSGAMPSVAADGAADVRRAVGARSFYQHAHEIWLSQGGYAIAVQGVAPDRSVDTDVIVAFPGPIPDPLSGPAWTQPLISSLQHAGLGVRAVDGGRELSTFDASTNPAMAYARAFGEQQMLVLWLTSEIRSRLLSGLYDAPTARRLERLGHEVPVRSAARRALVLAGCGDSPTAAECPSPVADCRPEVVVASLVSYTRSSNPYALRAALEGHSCHVEVVRDTTSDRVWAIVSQFGDVWIVPLRVGPLADSGAVLADLGEIERALALGLGVIRVGGRP